MPVRIPKRQEFADPVGVSVSQPDHTCGPRRHTSEVLVMQEYAVQRKKARGAIPFCWRWLENVFGRRNFGLRNR